jgi:ribosomal protein L11 methyltransferase
MAPRLYAAIDVSWASLTSAVDESAIDLLLAELDAAAPAAVETRDDGVRIFFGSTAERDKGLRLAAEAAPDARVVGIDVSDEAWAERNQSSLNSVRVEHLVVSPPWRVGTMPLEPSDIEIVIQPSMGFGTGHHESTRLCLGLLQTLSLHKRDVLDIGTGSGVLAIAAARLGAQSVLAVDVDPDALANARENVVANGVETAIETACVDVTSAPPARRFDVVTANLTGALLSRAADLLANLVNFSGSLVISGVTLDEELAVIGRLETAGFQLERRVHEREWLGAVLTRLT